MGQEQLFDIGVSPADSERRARARRNLGTPAMVGSGPSGETCKTCSHYTRVHYHDKVWRKCGLMKPYWTHGPGTDIKASWPACMFWNPFADANRLHNEVE
jgi:hypothetical protein